MAKNGIAVIEGLTVTSLDAITAFSPEDNSLLFALEELQEATISNAEETQDVTGKSGRKLDIIKQNKSVTISATNGLISAGLMATQTGGDYEFVNELEVSYNETITITDPELAYTSYVAVGLPGAEIKTVVRESAGGILNTINQLKQGATAEAGVFTYDPTTRALGFAPDEFVAGDKIRVFYSTMTEGAKVDNPTDAYSGQAHLIVDLQVRDRCGKTFHGQIDAPKASVNGNFDIKAGQDQCVHNFEAEVLASIGSCDANLEGKKNIFYSFMVFGMDEPLPAPTEPETPVTPQPPVTTDPDDEEKPVTGGDEGDDTDNTGEGNNGENGDGEDTDPTPVDKSALTAKIADAEASKENVQISEDGEGLDTSTLWVTQDDMDALDAAITAAEAVAGNEDATQDEVDGAVTTLDTAIKAFEDALQVA